ncbi:MAG: FAD-binding oxidoreductase [Betaproteobacteria bacterium]|nr:FAD-binding oxidoreductase [Betaproteobacteria bacterium]
MSHGGGLAKSLMDLLGPNGWLAAPTDTAPYLTDWRGNYTGKALGVARPATTEEVAAVVRLCSEYSHPIVPQGGNTGLVGGGIPDASGNAVLLSTQRLSRIRTIDPAGNTIVAEAGCILATLQAAALDQDRLFPLSLAAEGSCTVGGNLSTNAGGTQVVRYGNMRDQVLGLEVVLPSGDIWSSLKGLRKDNTGYDLKHLFIGAEGTLGIITAAILKLQPLPKMRVTALVAVQSPAAAVALFANIRNVFGDRLEGFEIFSALCLQLVLKHIPGTRDPFATPAPWQVLIELADTQTDAPLGESLEAVLGAAAERGEILGAVIATSEAQAAELWKLREEISEAQKREGKSIKHDISVPIARLPEFIDKADAALQRAFPGIRIVNFGHIGDGNLHYNCSMPEGEDNLRILSSARSGRASIPSGPPAASSDISQMSLLARSDEVNRVVYDIVNEVGGSISAEHGLGILKREEILRHKSPVEMQLMRAVKQALDPKNLMNPGKVL